MERQVLLNIHHKGKIYRVENNYRNRMSCYLNDAIILIKT